MWKRRRPGGLEHLFTDEDREAQLSDLENACERLAELLAENREVSAAESYRVRARNAARLLADGFTKADLNELAGQFPDEPSWLNPKALDYDAKRELWQDEVARLHATARATAMDLRAVATLYRA